MNQISIENSNDPKLYTDGRGLYSIDRKTLYYVCSASTSPYTVLSTVETLFDGAFVSYQASSVTLQNGLKTINYFCFARSSITSITLPNSVESCREQSFSLCSKLKTVTLSENLTFLAVNMFSSSGLTTITFPNNVTYIDTGALSSCPNLLSVYLPNPIPELKGGFLASSPKAKLYMTDNSVININDENVMFNSDNSSVIAYFGTSETSIHLPSTIKTIGAKVFSYKTNIKEVLCEGTCQIQNVEANAFVNCTNLVTIPSLSYVKTIGQRAFEGCPISSPIQFSSALTLIKDYAFLGNNKIPQITFEQPSTSLTISDYAFQNCSSLTTISFPSQGSISLGNYAFFNCNSLSSITITSANVSIGQSCFMNSGINSLIFEGNKVCNGIIPAFCFKNCINLQSVSIPSNCTILDIECFAMTSIKTVKVTDNLEIISRQSFKDCQYLENLEIPNSSHLKSIEPAAFQGCIRFYSVKMFQSEYFYSDSGAIYNFDRSQLIIYPPAAPNKFLAISDRVRYIQQSCFIGCTNLDTVLIPDNSVTSIGPSAFEGCTNLRVINIPLSVQSVGLNAFLGCKNLLCGIAFENKTSAYKTMLIEASLSFSSLRSCIADSCQRNELRFSFSYSFLFPFILLS
ncbi:surface antigen BspA-like [Trichomonas vaginalis G3]|uniref:Surface antigen BspA-like n=1 Tax=Trichomonas vaginalis (strain ATCC PRA-98 / G3) TaxID=412133 RepID=A2F4S1_TRIV3|nr:antigen BSP-related family [Trichomonas vaginalis G3]EAY00084.1 surface antigen BspA-like [Trichomonas vaginalis G3]KAI5547140.1 antigen BSP-related family [Trichomonas vaginalis G3]|eukprot:XP_001313013.1 surface antigen BspA-like [Trichomonas vaginalis G3]